MTHFTELLTELEKFPASLPANELHGFLTAANITPKETFIGLPWVQVVLGLPAQTKEADIFGFDIDLLLLALVEIESQLAEEKFVPITTTSSYKGKLLPDTHEWANGFLKVIAIQPEEWEAISEYDLEFAAYILDMNILSHPEKFADLKYGDEVDPHSLEFLQEIRFMAGPIAKAMFDVKMNMDMDLLPFDDTSLVEAIDKLHEILSAENLASYSSIELYDLVFEYDDRLPLTVIDEFVHREQEMLPLMAKYTDEHGNWIVVDDDESEELWPLLHHIFILGKMRSQEAARQLLVYLTNQNKDIFDSRWDWVSAYWPALFDSKTEFVKQELMALITDSDSEDDSIYEYVNILLRYTETSNPEEFESIIDLLAQRLSLIKNKFLTYHLANILLDSPRDRHRNLLEQLAKEQDKMDAVERCFSLDEVESSYSKGDQPEYKRFFNPWEFYERKEILLRQLRWQSEEGSELDTPPELEYDNWMKNYEPVETFIRETEKVGRNDPCPCGSGKKYKKCCLH